MNRNTVLVKRVQIVLPCLLAAAALLLPPACDAQTNSEDVRTDVQEEIVGAAADLPADPDQALEAGSLQFDGELYHFAWTAQGLEGVAQEYVRSGETVESWTQMLAFSVIEGVFEDLVNQYLDARRPWMVLEPDIREATYSPYANDVIIRLVLAAHDGFDAEFVLVRAITNPEEPVRTLVFSKKLVSTEEADLAPILARTDDWIAQLADYSL